MANISTFIGASGGAGGSGGGGYTRTLFVTGSGTVNPSTDLGLSDGDTFGFLLVGGGQGGSGGPTNGGRYGGQGGRHRYGSSTVNVSATDITVTIGAAGNGGSSNGNNLSVGGQGGNTSLAGAGIDNSYASNDTGLYFQEQGGLLLNNNQGGNDAILHPNNTHHGFGNGGVVRLGNSSPWALTNSTRGQGGSNNSNSLNPKTGTPGIGGVAVFYY